MGRRLYQNNEDNFKGFNCKQVFFSNFNFTRKIEFFKLTSSFWYYDYVYPWCLKAWYKSKLKSKSHKKFFILIGYISSFYEL